MKANEEFRNEISVVSLDALNEVKSFISGEEIDKDRLNVLLKILTMGLKVEHMNQIQDIQQKTFAMRLLKFLPPDVDRDEYIRLTSPTPLPKLEMRPKPKK